MSRLSRSDVNTSLLPLPWVDTLLPDNPAWDEQGLLPAAKMFSALPVRIPAWQYRPVAGLVTRLDLYWNEALFKQKEWADTVVTLPPADLLHEVPDTLLTPGIHALWYRVQTPLGNWSESLRQTVTIDTVPPVLGANTGQLQFATTSVTEQYLKDHDDRVEAVVPDYSGSKPGDVLTWYWNEDPYVVNDADIVSTQVLYRADIGKPLVLVFSGAMIRARGDGQRYAFYRVNDRAGNFSPDSRPVQLQVAAQPVPRELPPPRVQEASGSASGSTLNPGSAYNGVTVVIQPAATLEPTDVVCVQWAEPDSVGSYRADTPATPGSREYKVPANRIAQHLRKSIPVYYEVFEKGVGLPLISKLHTLNISALSGLPTVQCDKVSGGKLSLGTIVEGGYASFTLNRWSFMATDQFINVEVRGTDSSNQKVVVKVLTSYAVPQVESIIDVGRIAKSDLQRFKIGGGLTVYVEVSFDNKTSWQPFPTLTPVLAT